MSYIIDQKQAEAMAWFLLKEYLRHQKDMDQIQNDLTRLKEKWKIEIPDPQSIDVNEWVEI